MRSFLLQYDKAVGHYNVKISFDNKLFTFHLLTGYGSFFFFWQEAICRHKKCTCGDSSICPYIIISLLRGKRRQRDIISLECESEISEASFLRYYDFSWRFLLEISACSEHQEEQHWFVQWLEYNRIFHFILCVQKEDNKFLFWKN